jgi:acyl-CoA synthetase (AMP-forming)/AMP-acid ligase II
MTARTDPGAPPILAGPWPDPVVPTVPGSSGRLLPGVRARIIDPGAGTGAGTGTGVGRGVGRGHGEAGELCVRIPSLMAGYLGNPDATAATPP